jgi:hypothetical protein
MKILARNLLIMLMEDGTMVSNVNTDLIFPTFTEKIFSIREVKEKTSFTAQEE